ncbi:hypothetical protein CEXT_626091 [Caerostris extrusa]|uniref:Uncharacterized protein n=1 Tax=Caerostris extrusa TaxID=172846 RepID=A0AAV4XWF4_CAEEX|nr:hypothetical protein CEXT_626091 [Caerostris extrusa]
MVSLSVVINKRRRESHLGECEAFLSPRPPGEKFKITTTQFLNMGLFLGIWDIRDYNRDNYVSVHAPFCRMVINVVVCPLLINEYNYSSGQGFINVLAMIAFN